MLGSGLVVQVVSALLHGNWQDFNCHDASRGPSATAELLVKRNSSLRDEPTVIDATVVFIASHWCFSITSKRQRRFFLAGGGGPSPLFGVKKIIMHVVLIVILNDGFIQPNK